MKIIVDQFGFPIPTQRRRRYSLAGSNSIAARWDAVQTTDHNKRHWANADSLSAIVAASPSVRQLFRNRARYEYNNNTYCRGIIDTLTNSRIGRGPRLMMQTTDQGTNRQIQDEYSLWAKRIRKAQKLRTANIASDRDGESFIRFINEDDLEGPVKLSLRVHETEECASPANDLEADVVDGIRVDGNLRPTEYHILDHHPGGDPAGNFGVGLEGTWYPARNILHLFVQERPGQLHGLPRIAASLPLFAILRRYTLATLEASETAANISGVMTTEGPADANPDEVDPFLPIELERNTFMSMPFGWRVMQMKAEQPATVYPDFKREVLREIARCCGVPFNVAAGDSSDYNYASGRLDHQTFFKMIQIEQHDQECVAVDRIFEEWLREYLAVTSGIAPSSIDLSFYPHRWIWDAHEHVDPEKEAKAAILLWEKGLLTDEDYWLAAGKRPEEQYEGLQRQNAARERIGLPMPQGESAREVVVE